MKKSGIILSIVLIIVAIGIGYMVGKRAEMGEGIPSQPMREGSVGDKRSVTSGLPGTNFEVIDRLKERVEKDPNDAVALAYLGDAYFGMRQFEDAVKYYERAISVDPEDVDTYNDLGLSNHYIGMSDKGLEYVERGIEVNPYYQRIWLTKGFILAATGRISEGRAAWEKAAAIDPNSDVGKAAASFLAEYAAEGFHEGR